LAELINEVADEASFLLVPAFAVGRTQELIYTIRQLEDQGRVPALPVHLDSPMAASATDIYCKYTEEHALDLKRLSDEEICSIRTRHFTLHRSIDDSKAINALRGPRIIISASGMATGGRILHHLKLRLPDPKTTILFIGFQAEGTRGRSLQEGKEMKIFGELVAVRAKIRTIGGFSAHADQGEILRWLRNFEKAPRKTFIVHGEPSACSVLADRIRQGFKWQVEIPKYGDKVALS
jgi:metallo-beta-lactamase family protein